MMTEIEAFDRACALWGKGVAWKLSDRCVVGRWAAVGEYQGTHEHRIKLRSHDRAGRELQACIVMGEGKSWEEAFAAAERRAAAPEEEREGNMQKQGAT